MVHVVQIRRSISEILCVAVAFWLSINLFLAEHATMPPLYASICDVQAGYSTIGGLILQISWKIPFRL